MSLTMIISQPTWWERIGTETLEPEIISPPNHNKFLWQAGRMGNINSPQTAPLIFINCHIYHFDRYTCLWLMRWMMWGISSHMDWLLIFGFWLSWISVICNSEAALGVVTLPLRTDWGAAFPVPNPQMCEELQNLKWPQQEPQSLCEAAEALLGPVR